MLKTYVFVYGTLRKEQVNHYLLEDAMYCGDFVTPAKFKMFDLGAYPGVTSGGRSSITGEVYEIDRKQFARLDQLEGYPQLYDRKLIPTPFGQAWIYLYKESLAGRKLVVGGDWVKHAGLQSLSSRNRDYCSVR